MNTVGEFKYERAILRRFFYKYKRVNNIRNLTCAMVSDDFLLAINKYLRYRFPSYNTNILVIFIKHI